MDVFRCFIFLNQENGITANNLHVSSGRLHSASCGLLPDRLNDLLSGVVHWRLDQPPDANCGGFMSPFAASQLGLGGWRAQLESDAERIRAMEFPHRPSRLACIFAFPDLETCKRVAAAHGWDMRQVSEMDCYAMRAAHLDMQIVSYANYVYEAGRLTADAADQMWRTYWSGGSIGDLGLTSPPVSIQEVLVDGYLVPVPD